MKISCRQAAEICTRSQYGESNLWERFKLRLHLARCRECKRFSSRNAKLTDLCDKAGLCCLTEKDKQGMKRKLEGEA